MNFYIKKIHYLLNNFIHLKTEYFVHYFDFTFFARSKNYLFSLFLMFYAFIMCGSLSQFNIIFISIIIDIIISVHSVHIDNLFHYILKEIAFVLSFKKYILISFYIFFCIPRTLLYCAQHIRCERLTE